MNYWIDFLSAFDQQAMAITGLMYGSWMFTFMHIYEAVYAAKNKRVSKFIIFENVLDFWIMVLGMFYITVVYKVYRWNTFISSPAKESRSCLFFYNYKWWTEFAPDQAFLVVIDATYIIKGLVQLRLLPVIGPVYAIFKSLLGQLAIFACFFFMQQFLFSVVGNLIFHDTVSYGTITEAMLTMFKASAGDFKSNEEMVNSREGPGWGYTFILTYMLLNFILIINIIVGQLSSAYKRFIKNRS
jgi:hypothetical protein